MRQEQNGGKIRIITADPRKDVQAALFTVYIISFTSKKSVRYTTHERTYQDSRRD